MSPPQPQSAMSSSMYSEASSSALSPNTQYQQQQIPNPQQNQPENTFNPQNAFSLQPAFSPQPTQSSYIPEPPPMLSPDSMKKTANHIPGMVNPLICDDSQGDFGANTLVRPDSKYILYFILSRNLLIWTLQIIPVLCP